MTSKRGKFSSSFGRKFNNRSNEFPNYGIIAEKGSLSCRWPPNPWWWWQHKNWVCLGTFNSAQRIMSCSLFLWQEPWNPLSLILSAGNFFARAVLNVLTEEEEEDLKLYKNELVHVKDIGHEAKWEGTSLSTDQKGLVPVTTIEPLPHPFYQ